jgi:hypothetical protein
MRTIRTRSKGPGARTEVGNAVLASARALEVEALAPRVAAFEKAHAAFLAADAKVSEAEEALARQSRQVGAADAAQDAAVMKLASALVADGLPRQNPFKPLGFAAPSTLTHLGYGREAELARRLSQAVLGRDGVGKAAADAARSLDAAAREVQKALEPVESLTEARAAAVRLRDTLGFDWEARLAALKLAARAADVDGARGTYAALFGEQRPRAKRRKPAPPPAAS